MKKGAELLKLLNEEHGINMEKIKQEFGQKVKKIKQEFDLKIKEVGSTAEERKKREEHMARGERYKEHIQLSRGADEHEAQLQEAPMQLKITRLQMQKEMQVHKMKAEEQQKWKAEEDRLKKESEFRKLLEKSSVFR